MWANFLTALAPYYKNLRAHDKYSYIYTSRDIPADIGEDEVLFLDSWAASVALRELWTFTACRIGTGVVEVGMMWLFVDILSFNCTLMKLVTNFIVIVLNYIFSKLIIFKKK